MSRYFLSPQKTALVFLLAAGVFWFFVPFQSSDAPRQAPYRFVQEREAFERGLLVDPHTGMIPQGIKKLERSTALKQPEIHRKNSGTITSMGPVNYGGRTRAILVDLADSTGNTLLAGGVSSGVFRSTDHGESWTKVSPDWAIHSVTTLAQDPSHPEIIYYGTGEALGNSASHGSFWLGDGIWKSSDGGLTFTQLASTSGDSQADFDNSFDIVHRIVVHPVSGDIYVAAHRRILRSRDGGETWETLISGDSGTSFSAGYSDIAINATGSRIYAAMNGRSKDRLDGVYISSSGAMGSFSKIAGTDSNSTPEGWKRTGAYGRIVLAVDPSNEFRLYAFYENGHRNDCRGSSPSSPEADLFRWDGDQSRWTDLSDNLPDETPCSSGNSPLAVQGGYDLCMAVSPLDSNLVVIGGTNLYVSTTAFKTPDDFARIGGYYRPGSYGLFPNSHPDMHACVFNPFEPTHLLNGNDGGIYDGDVTSDPAHMIWTNLNNDYVTYQYYHVGISPIEGDVRVIGGAQDNGTTIAKNSPIHNSVAGGDGVAVGIASYGFGQTLFCGSQLGNLYRKSGLGFSSIAPKTARDGLFVTYFLLDPDNNNNLYYADYERIYRTGEANSVTSGSWERITGVEQLTGSDYVYSMAVTRGPYTTDSKLYFGTDAGKIYLLIDPQGSPLSTLPTNITPPQSEGGIISSIAVDPLDDQILVATISNYGVPSIFYSENAGQNWQVIEGNLALPSIRSSAIVNYGTYREIFVGTSVGLWSTREPAGPATRWLRESLDGVILPIVTSLSLRPSDNHMAIGTHGNGMYYAKLKETTLFSSEKTHIYLLPKVYSDAYDDTLFRIVNPSSEAFAEVEIYGFSNSGQPLGPGTDVLQLWPRNAAEFRFSEIYPSHYDELAWIEIGSSEELVVFAELQSTETRSAYLASKISEKVFLPHIAKNTQQFETILAAVNGTSGTSQLELTIKPGNDSYDLGAASSGFSAFDAPLTDVISGDLSQGPDIWGMLQSQNGAHSAMELFRTLPERSREASLGLNSEQGKTLRFLHVAVNTETYWTGMVYINTGDAQSTIVENYYQNSGELIKSESLTLDSGQKRTLLYDSNNQIQVPAGTGWIEVTSTENLIGYELFGSPGSSQDDNFAGLKGSFNGSSHLIYPYFHSDASFFTGIVAVNLADEPATIHFKLISEQGAVMAEKAVTDIPGKSKFTGLVGNGADPLFSDISQGSWILAESEQPIAGFLLWGDHQVSSRRYLSGLNAMGWNP